VLRDAEVWSVSARQDDNGSVKQVTKILAGLLALGFSVALLAQVQIGDRTQISGGGTVSVGYSGDDGNDTQSNHGLTFGFGGGFDGYYYNPNFINFNITPYYNQSRADSNYQSLTDASGVAASANFFTGSHFPGSVSYHYDYNSTGTFGLSDTPNFTTQGNGQGLGINWAVLFPGWPTISVGYQYGTGSGTLYGTDQKTSSKTGILNVRSGYQLEGFNLNAYYDHSTLNGFYPEILTGTANFNDSTGYDTGISASRNIPFWNGAFSANYSHTSYGSDYLTEGVQANNSGYAADLESANANFRPTERLSLFANENYTNNLSSYFLQGLGPNNPPLPGTIPNLGQNSYSLTMGGGAAYMFTQHLNANTNITHYSQSYLGNNYGGTFLAGNVNYNRKLLDTFTFTVGVVEGSSNFNNSNLGFIGTINGFHRIGQWQVSGNFSYAQNVQSQLITYTTSYYNYNGNLHRRFSNRVQWTAAFNGGHSGFSQQGNASTTSANFSTSLSLRTLAFTANYGSGSGNSLLTANGVVPLPPIPGEPDPNLIYYNAKNYGGGISWTPIRRMVLTGTYSRSLSNTLSNDVFSRNNTEVIYSQMQYRLRRLSLLGGYTRFTQGISATGQLPGTVNSYYVGISRWFDFF
jgi:hypothetical protein